MRISLKHLIVPSIPLAVLLVGCCYAFWGVDYFFPLQMHSNTIYNPIAERVQNIFLENSFLINALSGLITLLNAFLLVQLNNRFALIRTRTFLPVIIYLFLIGIWEKTHLNVSSHLALTIFILGLFNFFSMSHNKNATEQAFMGSFFVALAGLLVFPYLYLIPVCWIGFMMLRSFSLRTFLASLFGILAPWVIFLSYLYFIHKLNILWTVFSGFNLSFSLQSLSLIELIYTGLMLIILIIAIVGIFSNSNQASIQTRNKLNFLLWLIAVTLFVAIFSIDQLSMFLPLLALIYALLVSHPFTLIKNKIYSTLFLVFVVLNISFVIIKHLF